MRLPLHLGLLFCALFVAACGDGESEVVFMRDPSQHANLPTVSVYVAQARGFFDSEGLEVAVVPSGESDPLSAVEAGEATFASVPAAALIARHAERAAGGAELDVVAIAVIGQRGDMGYVVIRGSGIEGPADFAGRVVGANSASLPALRGMLANEQVDASAVAVEQVASDDLNRFLGGELDAYPVQLSSEPYALRRAGHDVAAIDPADFGVPMIGQTVVTRRSLLAEDPALVESFVRAVLRGAMFASDHIDDAIDVTLPNTDGVDPDQQSYVLETQLAAAGGGGIGRGSHDQWQALIDLLAEHGSLTVPIEVTDVFDGSIVDEVYRSGALD